jgi:hypothetical protein
MTSLPTRPLLLLVLALGLLPACGSNASRTILWDWSYVGVGDEALIASGTLLTGAEADENGWYTIEGISGERAGVEITGLYPAGENIPGNVDRETGVPYRGNNLIRAQTSLDEPQLDVHGLQFALADGTYSNVFYAIFLDPPVYLDFHSVPPFPDGAVPPNSEPVVRLRAEIVGPVPGGG